MKIPAYFFIFDVESLGLHGDGFAVAGGVWKGLDQCLMEFAYHTSQDRALIGIAGDAEWVKKNVIISPQSTLCGGTAIMNSLFWNEWKRAKEQYPGIVMAAECLWPVEARLLQKAVDEDRDNRNWEGPYPIHEIASFMLAAGMDPMATYERRENELPAHEPLADARLSARLLFEALEILKEREGAESQYREIEALTE